MGLPGVQLVAWLVGDLLSKSISRNIVYTKNNVNHNIVYIGGTYLDRMYQTISTVNTDMCFIAKVP